MGKLHPWVHCADNLWSSAGDSGSWKQDSKMGGTGWDAEIQQLHIQGHHFQAIEPNPAKEEEGEVHRGYFSSLIEQAQVH